MTGRSCRLVGGAVPPVQTCPTCKNRAMTAPTTPSSPATGELTTPSDPSGADNDVARLSYEQAREELMAVVHRLEAGSPPLEESLTLWERGEALAARCQTWLDDARSRLTAVQRTADDPGAGQDTTPVT